MKNVLLRLYALALLLGVLTFSASAQSNQIGTQPFNDGSSLTIFGNVGPACGSTTTGSPSRTLPHPGAVTTGR
ncbi:MAG: hypothetical protein IPO05_12255 [Flavobacteriales bacterium]|nr:hypothetical protein [Flavobacteriales bacterium]